MKSKKEFYDGVVDEVQATRDRIRDARAQIRKLEEKNKSGSYSFQKIAENKEEIRSLERDIESMRSSGKTKIETLCNEYAAELQAEDALKGSEMTPDANLLTSGLSLTKDDLSSMLDRNQGNRTMLQLVLRYAKDHEIDMGLSYVGNGEAIETLKAIPYTADVVMKWSEQNEVFDRLMGEGSDLGSWASD